MKQGSKKKHRKKQKRSQSFPWVLASMSEDANAEAINTEDPQQVKKPTVENQGPLSSVTVDKTVDKWSAIQSAFGFEITAPAGNTCHCQFFCTCANKTKKQTSDPGTVQATLQPVAVAEKMTHSFTFPALSSTTFCPAPCTTTFSSGPKSTVDPSQTGENNNGRKRSRTQSSGHSEHEIKHRLTKLEEEVQLLKTLWQQWKARETPA